MVQERHPMFMSFILVRVEKSLSKVQDWRQYRATVRELDHFSDRELDDLGIRRSDIRRVARSPSE
jgi:uncharacterized protein YjiS (DUF1127 family)